MWEKIIQSKKALTWCVSAFFIQFLQFASLVLGLRAHMSTQSPIDSPPGAPMCIAYTPRRNRDMKVGRSTTLHLEIAMAIMPVILRPVLGHLLLCASCMQLIGMGRFTPKENEAVSCASILVATCAKKN